MGISPKQMWDQSKNGKAMVLMLAGRDNPEVVAEILDWLVGVYENDLKVGYMKRGANKEQAKVAAENATAGLTNLARSVSDRNQYAVAEQVIDHVFKKHFYAQPHPQVYNQAMAWFSDELRKRFKNDDEG